MNKPDNRIKSDRHNNFNIVSRFWLSRLVLVCVLVGAILLIQIPFINSPLTATAHLYQQDDAPSPPATSSVGETTSGGAASTVLYFPSLSMGEVLEATSTPLPSVTPTSTPPPNPTPTPTEPPILTGDGTWSMAGANPQRTSWTVEEVRGVLKPEWFTHFDAYISQKVQIIAADDKLFISASDGLHALNSNSGREIWFYPTELPLGHSPTYVDGVVYVGGFDRKIHAINATTGQNLWTFTAGAGFHTNPLVVNGKLYAGNRDGSFYAINTEGSQTGQLAWKYDTEGPILLSAAYADGVVYFASNDMHAYALDSQTGGVIWKSAKLPGYGFHSFWPVVYRDYVIFSGTWNYRTVSPGPPGNHNLLERLDVYPDTLVAGDPIGPYGTEPGDWIAGTTTIDARNITNYFEEKPWRRTYFMLNRSNGQEFTFDSDNDGNLEYAPILYFGAKGGTRYPPAVGPDGVIYQANNYINNDWIPRGHVSGWKVGTQYISLPTDETNAVDEPMGFSIGGTMVYWRRCCDRKAGAFDLSGSEDRSYFDEGSTLRSRIPELFDEGWEFAYWKHGDPSAPIPYNGRVYEINNNAVVAFSTFGRDPSLTNEDLGSATGVSAEDIEGATTITGLNTKVTLDSTSWPRLIQQERYFEIGEDPGTRTTYFQLMEVKGAESGAPAALNVQNTNISRHLVSTFGGSQQLDTWISNRAPNILFSNSSNVYRLAGQFVHLAYPTSQGVQILSTGGSINGSVLSGGWLLLWDATSTHRWAPLVISLENRPSQISLDGAGVLINYSSSAGYLAVTPLYGMSAPKSSEEQAWPSGLPAETIARVELLNQISLSFPEQSQDGFAIVPQSGDVQLTYQYQYRTFQDDWGTSARQMAYLPAHLALAAWNGSPIRINGQPLEQWTDLNFVTPVGRIAAVENVTTITVVLPGLANYWRELLASPTIPPSNDPLRIKLVSEIQKIIAVGHLKPGYGNSGLWDGKATNRIGQYLADFWHNPAELIYTLFRAMPYLPSDVQTQARQYIQSEFGSFPPYATAHSGWAAGTSRLRFDLPPEVSADFSGFPACDDCNSWGFPPENHYASWLYAQEFGDAVNIFSHAQAKLDTSPDLKESTLYLVNSYIAGYIGYLRLAELASASSQSDVEKTLVDMLVLRAALSKYPNALAETGFEYGGYKWSVRVFAPNQADTLFIPRIIGSLWSQLPLYGYPRHPLYGLSGAGQGGGYFFGIDYVNLTPELAEFLHDYANIETSQAVADYNQRAPYWFVGEAEEAAGEAVVRPVYDVVALFQAKALILNENRSALEKYLDVPIVETGDLYYIQNLISALGAGN